MPTKSSLTLFAHFYRALYAPIVKKLLVDKGAVSIGTAVDQAILRDQLNEWIVKESRKPLRGSEMFSIFSIFEPSRPPIPLEQVFNKTAAQAAEETRSRSEVLDALLYTISKVDETIHCDEGRCWADT